MGRLRRRGGQRGFALLDVLVAMAIALVGLAACLAALGTAARIVTRQAERARIVIEQRNGDETKKVQIFQGR